ncbi:hypothetical protein PG999_005456 [Apiospora kogelbergensis]|uniref:F-box domain-containing protein n=1 Tax=Apiospora kogelbergensis TaxID=1337665 RepID=A0AAW0R291_9PEZI
MNTLPFEIVSAIAGELDSVVDIANFRLVNHMCAAVATPIQAQHIAVLNTAESLEELSIFLRAHPHFARHAKHLSIYHATWPICTRDVWETHPLLLGGNDRMGVEICREHPATDEAFGHYRHFISTEARRNPVSDAETLARILKLLPRVNQLTLSHVQTWSWKRTRNAKYTRLRRKIWMSAFFRDSIGAAVSLALPVLNDFPQVHYLEIQGSLNPYDIYTEGRLQSITHIRTLHILSLEVFSGTQQAATNLLQAFPNVTEISLKLATNGSHTAILLQDLQWPHLRFLDLRNMWSTENDIKAMLGRHCSLERVMLREMTLFSGSWRSLLEYKRACLPALYLELGGSLHNEDTRLSIDVSAETAQQILLSNFLNDSNFPWPFQV